MEFAPFLSPSPRSAASTSGTVLLRLACLALAHSGRVITSNLLAVSEMEPGSVGLALSYAVTLTGMFQWGVRQSAEIENMVRTFEEEMFGLGLLSSSYMIK